MKRKVSDKTGASLIDPYLPSTPLMAQAWVDCLRWSGTEPEILAAFRAETGCDFSPGRTPIERMIDQATGSDRKFIEQYIAWFNENV